MRSFRTLSLLALPAVFAVAFLAGCDNKQKDQMTLMTQENEDLRKQLTERNAALESCERERTAAVARADAADKTPAAATQSGDDGGSLASGGGTYTKVGNEVHLTIDGDVLFDSGKPTLKAEGKKSLDKVAATLREKYPGRMIRVAGFTDSDPIKKSKYPSNYHLAFDRAYSVREYLISKGLDGKLISLWSFGPDAPLSTKAKSRRVEFIVAGTAGT